ncbi:hypothetical protein ABPG72_007714 [Tetrahymena utriculariae]
MQKLNYESPDKKIYKITVSEVQQQAQDACTMVSITLVYITQQHISYLNGWTNSSKISLYIGLITSSLSLGCLIGSLFTSQFFISTNYNQTLSHAYRCFRNS